MILHIPVEYEKGIGGDNLVVEGADGPYFSISMVWSPSTKLLLVQGLTWKCRMDIENRSIRKKFKDHTDMIMHIVAIEKLVFRKASLDKSINLYGMRELRHYGQCKVTREATPPVCTRLCSAVALSLMCMVH